MRRASTAAARGHRTSERGHEGARGLFHTPAEPRREGLRVTSTARLGRMRCTPSGSAGTG
eukprot:4441902-Prymnesium_polylepis.1